MILMLGSVCQSLIKQDSLGCSSPRRGAPHSQLRKWDNPDLEYDSEGRTKD